MARPRKSGVDYFPFDVGFFEDEKIACISGEFGSKGETVVVKLLCAIYKNGYYTEMTDRLKYTIVRGTKDVSVGLFEQIVARLVKWDFFDSSLFNSAKVLTSAAIQRRYFSIVKRREKTGNYPYLLVSAELTGLNPTEMGVSVCKNTPKEKKIKNNSLTRVIKKSAGGGLCLAPSIGEVEEFFKIESLQGSATTFFNYYQARNWQTNNAPIADWRAVARVWSARETPKTDENPKRKPQKAKSDMELIRATERRQAKEAAEQAAREAVDNPDGLSSAQSLAEYKRKRGLSPDQSITSISDIEPSLPY